MRRILWMLCSMLILSGCQIATKPDTNKAEQKKIKQDKQAVITEDKLTTITFQVEGTSFNIEIPSYFEETPDEVYPLNLIGERGDIFLEGARKVDIDGIAAFKKNFLDYYLDYYKETMRKESLKSEKLTIADYTAEKTSLEMVEEGYVFQYEGYVIETEDCYLLISVSGKKSFFSNEVDYLKLLNSLKVDNLATGTDIHI